MSKNNYKLRLTANLGKILNKHLFLHIIIGCWIVLALFRPTMAYGHDWPMWRYDAGRRASSPEELPTTMHLQWVRELAPPKPAWPKSQYRLQFDAYLC
jgi:hypothetical protein